MEQFNNNTEQYDNYDYIEDTKPAEKPAENKMGIMPMNRLLITMGLPMMISMLVQALYNIVDSVFVARIGEDALTAVSMAFPVQNLMIGVSSGLAVGTNALVSRALGEKNQAKANKTAMQGILLAFMGYLIFLLFGIFGRRIIFELQGASSTIADYGEQYLFFISALSLGLFVQVTMERLLQSTGRTVPAMFSQGLGAIINLILDPIMIFGLYGCPKMGIAGAAIATITGQFCAGLLGLILNIKVNKEIQLSISGLLPDFKIIRNIMIIGVPSVIMIAIGSIMNFSINKILIAFTSTAVAVFGVYFKLQSFAFMPLFGLNNGMIPIVAYNYGAKKYDRMLSCRRYGILYAELIMVTFLILVQAIPDKLMMLFNASESMMNMGIMAMRIISVHFVFAGFCIISSSFFQALGKSMYSAIISFVRQLVFLVPLAYLFAKTGDVNMVWVAWPIAELASVILCVIMQHNLKRSFE